jgi:hypothetical protein
MKTTYYQLLISFILCCLICLFAFLSIESCNKSKQKPASGNTTLVVKPPTQYTDDGGTVHTETAVDIEGINNYYQEVIDSLVKVIKAKPKVKAVQNVALIGTETNGSFKPKIDTVYLDTNHYESPTYIINYKDKWLKLKGYVNIDSAWQYQVVDSIGLVTYWRRKHWYSTRELYIDGFSFNPNTHLTGLSAMKLNEAKPKKWGVGFMVGYGLGKNLQPQPFVGFGIQRNFIRF